MFSFSCFFSFSADVSRIRGAQRMLDIPQNLANIKLVSATTCDERRLNHNNLCSTFTVSHI